MEVNILYQTNYSFKPTRYSHFDVINVIIEREGETVDKKEKAYELYLKGYKLIDISNEIGVKESTLRSWKKRGDWDNATAQRNGVPKSKKKRNVAKKNVAKTVATRNNEFKKTNKTSKGGK